MSTIVWSQTRHSSMDFFSFPVQQTFYFFTALPHGAIFIISVLIEIPFKLSNLEFFQQLLKSLKFKVIVQNCVLVLMQLDKNVACRNMTFIDNLCWDYWQRADSLWGWLEKELLFARDGLFFVTLSHSRLIAWWGIKPNWHAKWREGGPRKQMRMFPFWDLRFDVKHWPEGRTLLHWSLGACCCQLLSWRTIKPDLHWALMCSIIIQICSDWY